MRYLYWTSDWRYEGWRKKVGAIGVQKICKALRGQKSEKPRTRSWCTLTSGFQGSVSRKDMPHLTSYKGKLNTL